MFHNLLKGLHNDIIHKAQNKKTGICLIGYK